MLALEKATHFKFQFKMQVYIISYVRSEVIAFESHYADFH